MNSSTTICRSFGVFLGNTVFHILQKHATECFNISQNQRCVLERHYTLEMKQQINNKIDV